MLFIQANVQSQNLKLLKKQTIYEGKNLEENSSNFSKLNRSTNTVIWGVGGVGAANGEFSYLLLMRLLIVLKIIQNHGQPYLYMIPILLHLEMHFGNNLC